MGPPLPCSWSCPSPLGDSGLPDHLRRACDPQPMTNSDSSAACLLPGLGGPSVKWEILPVLSAGQHCLLLSELILLLCGLSLTITHHGWTGPVRSEGPGPGLVSSCSMWLYGLSQPGRGPCDILVSPGLQMWAAELPGPGRAQQLARMSWHCSPIPCQSGRVHPPSHSSPFPIRSLQHQPLHWAPNSLPDPYLHILPTSFLLPSQPTREMLFPITPIFSFRN